MKLDREEEGDSLVRVSQNAEREHDAIVYPQSLHELAFGFCWDMDKDTSEVSWETGFDDCGPPNCMEG